MLARVAVLSTFAALVVVPRGASAQARLHVYGPPGNGSARQVLAVVEDADGECARTDGPLRYEAEDGVEVTAVEPAGPCASWLELRSSRPRAHTTLLAHAPGISPRASVALGTDTLTVRLVRRGRGAAVIVSGAPDGESVTAIAHLLDGRRVELTPRGDGRFELPDAPPTTFGVLARSGPLVGADVVRGERTGEPSALILPVGPSVEAGGASRNAAYVVAVDARGRPSRALPLEIQSRGGQLRALRWVRPGLATVALSAPLGTHAIDLTVAIGGRLLARRELDVVAGWPARGELELPEAVERGSVLAPAARVVTVDGVELPADRLRLRCADRPLRPASAGCPTDALGSMTVGVLAMVDGTPVPLASATTRVDPPISAPEPAPPPVSEEPTARIAAYATGRYDLYGRFGVGAGGRFTWAAVDWLRIGVAVAYGGTLLDARRAQADLASLSGWRHAALASALAEIVVYVDPLAGLGARLEIGGGVVGASASIGDVPADGVSGLFVATLAAGPRLRVGDLELAVDVGVRVAADGGREAWEAAPVGGVLEVSGALGLR